MRSYWGSIEKKKMHNNAMQPTTSMNNLNLMRKLVIITVYID